MTMFDNLIKSILLYKGKNLKMERNGKDRLSTRKIYKMDASIKQKDSGLYSKRRKKNRSREESGNEKSAKY